MAFDDGVKTVSGSIAHTDDAATKVPFVSLKCGIAPTLTGKSAIECTQTGKNLISEIQQGGIDGTNGQETSSSTRVRTGWIKAFPSMTISVSITTDNPNLIIYHIIEYDASKTWIKSTSSTAQTRTLTLGSTTGYIRITSRDTTNAMITPTDLAKWQCEIASSPTTFEAYHGETATASLGRTIHGGTADVVNGTCEPINWLPNIATSKTQNGITWTVNSDGTVTLEGTSTARTYLYIHVYFKILPHDATITVNAEGLYDNGASDVFVNIPYSDNGTTYSGSYGKCTWANPTKQIDYTADKYIGFYIDCPSGVTTNQTVKITVSIGTTAHTYSPYFEPFTFTPITPTPETVGKVNNVYCNTGDTELTYHDNAHGFASVTVTKQAPDQADEVKTAYLHKVIFGGLVDVIQGKAEPKNLGELSAETYNQSQKCTWEYITGGAVVTATGTYARVGFVIPVETGKTYTVSYRGFSDGEYRRVYFNSTPAWSGQFYNNVLSDTDTLYTRTFTASTDVLFVGLYVTAGTTTGTLTFSDFMLVEGDQAEDFAPYFDPFSFPPISMETDDGENTLSANEGDSSITYRKAVD